MQKHFGLLMAAIATALTLLLVAGIADYLTSDYVGGEVAAARFITGFVGFLAMAAWVSAYVLLKPARRTPELEDQSNRI